MVNIQTSSKQRKQKHLKRKHRSRLPIDLGTPQVPLGNKQHKRRHELLSDWEDAP